MGRQEQRVLELIDQDALVDDLCQLIRGAGENPGDDTEQATVDTLRAMLEQAGATVETSEVHPGRPNLKATIGPGDGPGLLFLGHSDVVPAGEGWTTSPFDPVVVDGWVRGRGAADMKGGLACVVSTMRAVHQVAPWVRMDLLCTVDEEDRSTGVVDALDTWPAPGSGPGYHSCIVAEPTDLDLVVGCWGAANLLVGLTGVSAHSGRPEDGASAIAAAAVAVDEVTRQHARARAGQVDPLLGTPSWNVGTIQGGETASMVASSCVLTIDRRMMPEEDAEAIAADLLADIRGAVASSGIHGADRIRVSVTVDMSMPGFRTDVGSPLVDAAGSALAELGVDARVTGWTAACEGGWMARHHKVPTVVLGPGDVTTQAHQPDEGVRVDQLVRAAHAYALVALRTSPETCRKF